jgi:hypothetical protein
MPRGEGTNGERIDWSKLDLLAIADDVLERGNPGECFNFIRIVCEELTGSLLPNEFLKDVLGGKREAHLRVELSRMRKRVKKNHLYR